MASLVTVSSVALTLIPIAVSVVYGISTPGITVRTAITRFGPAMAGMTLLLWWALVDVAWWEAIIIAAASQGIGVLTVTAVAAMFGQGKRVSDRTYTWIYLAVAAIPWVGYLYL